MTISNSIPVASTLSTSALVAREPLHEGSAAVLALLADVAQGRGATRLTREAAPALATSGETLPLPKGRMEGSQSMRQPDIGPDPGKPRVP